MATDTTADLADQAMNRTTVPAASPAHREHDHEHGGHDGDHDDHEGHEHAHAFDLTEGLRIAATVAAAAAVWFRVWEPLQAVSVIGVAGLLFGGWPIFKEAVENLLERG